MFLFLYTFTINRARTSGKFYEELLKWCDDKHLKAIDISRFSVQQLQQEIDKAEIIVFDNSIILSINNVQLLSKNFYSKHKPKEFYFDVWYRVEESGKPVFFMHPSSDLHAVNFGLERTFYLKFLARLSGIFWPYHKCPLSRDNSEDKYPFTTLEPFKLKKSDLLSIWDEIKNTVPVSIDFPHCMPSYIMHQKERRKVWDVIIPGVSYETRRIAQDSVVKADLFVAPYVSFSKWLVLAPYMLYSKMIAKKNSTPIYQEKSFRFYRYMISMSKVSFACGSELRYFVRKFIEIPAFRSAMIAYPSSNFRDYGFIDGVHYLHCYPEEAGNKTKYLLQHKDTAEKLIQNAWELVAQKHVASVRVKQVLGCLDLFSKGKLKGAGYYEGNFEAY